MASALGVWGLRPIELRCVLEGPHLKQFAREDGSVFFSFVLSILRLFPLLVHDYSCSFA